MKSTIYIGAAAVLALLAPLMIVLLGGDSKGSASLAGVASNIPPEYAAIITKAGSICEGITPALIAAQIEAESNWNPTAVSHAGAQGIAQFMPTTWAVAGKDGDGDGVADVNNPQDAIWSQGHYMCDLLTSTRGLVEGGQAKDDPVDLALAAYNAGLGAVQSFGGIPPYPETMAYVEKIKSLAATRYAPTAAGGSNASVVAWAISQRGTPYRGEGSGACGSMGPDCYDCCGLVWAAFKNGRGIDLPMSIPGETLARRKCENALYSATQFGGTYVPADVSHLQPGDILAFQSTSVDPAVDYITHVALYIGNGEFIDAAPGYGVNTYPLGWGEAADKMFPQALRIP